jgi:ATP-dependent protease HslVU (ClpYQ) peptidase subunit
MTCIIGLIHDGVVYIGGDSAAVSTYVQSRQDKKVFRNGPMLMGFAGCFRMGQILNYALKIPDHPEGMEEMRYMVAHFIPVVKRCLNANTWEPDEDDRPALLVGYRNNLYLVDCDHQVGNVHDNILAIGEGDEIALGAMYALKSVPPVERITQALEIVSHLKSGVRPPFTVESI